MGADRTRTQRVVVVNDFAEYGEHRHVSERDVPVCTLCGRLNYGNAGDALRDGRTGLCGTCNRRPEDRDGYHERIDEYQRRADLGLPLFPEEDEGDE